jgi:amino acid transporter
MSELRKNSLSFLEVLGQSIANVSPTFTPALAVAVVAGMAGTASWLVYVLATLAMIIIGINVGKLAARIPAAGSFFIYVSRSLGAGYGMLTGWSMLAAYIFTAATLTIATSIFLNSWLRTIGLSFTIPPIFLDAAVSLLIWYLAVRDIRISSRIGLILEAISVVAILLVCVIAWSRTGFKADQKQLHLEGSDVASIAQAIVFGIFAFVGFESAATLGRETREPERNIPQAVILSSVLAGLFFVFTSYVLVLGFDDDTVKLSASTSPLGDLTKGNGQLLSLLVYLGATLSSFACALASLNAYGRMLFSLGRHRFTHASVGVIHAVHQTPYAALSVGAAINFLLCVALYGLAESDVIGYFGTVATFGFVFVYFWVSISAPVFLRKLGQARPRDDVLGAIGAVAMVLALVGSLYPIPPFPYNILPYLFALYLLIGVVWFLLVKWRAPAALLSVEHDLEASVGAVVPLNAETSGTTSHRAQVHRR